MKQFLEVEGRQIQKNVFNMSHDVKLSTKYGILTPCFLMDTLPGDKISIKTHALIRKAPQIAPIFHRESAYIHYFHIDNRLLMEDPRDWENYISGGEDGNDTTVWPHLDLTLAGASYGDLIDYMGLPVDNDVPYGASIKVSALPFAFYQKVYNDYYRDHNLITADDVALVPGTNNSKLSQLIELRVRAHMHDYFTSALPFSQRGSEALLPIQGQARVYGDDTTLKGSQMFRDVGTGAKDTTDDVIAWDGAVTDEVYTQAAQNPVYLDLQGTNYADLTTATQASINDLRRAFALQKFLERSARGGNRYYSYLRNQHGVNPSDYRLDRPFYMGGFKINMKTSEVLNTTPEFTGQTKPVGDMSGHGIGVGANDEFMSIYSEDHGWIIGILSVCPEPAYQQGVARMWTRSDKFDYFVKDFEHIGEQAILKKEIYLNTTQSTHEETFGYGSRFSEYKYLQNRVCSDFKDSLSHWHLGRVFASQPQLNQDFIEIDWNEHDRQFAVQDGTDNLWCHLYHEVLAQRPLTLFSEPKM